MRSVSATTRPPRNGEIDGVDYHFVSDDEFQRRRKRGDFLECFQVFGHGYWYGTLWSEVTTGLAAGKWVVLEIDVQGAQAVMERFPEAMTIFLRPRSREELEHRLRGRGTETEEALGGGWPRPIASWLWPAVTSTRSSTTTSTRRWRKFVAF